MIGTDVTSDRSTHFQRYFPKAGLTPDISKHVNKNDVHICFHYSRVQEILDDIKKVLSSNKDLSDKNNRVKKWL